jgi:hypothetical protein
MAQKVFVEVWDFDAGFLGILNDDFLGRSGIAFAYFTSFLASSSASPCNKKVGITEVHPALTL